jgi:hypothetical protein
MLGDIISLLRGSCNFVVSYLILMMSYSFKSCSPYICQPKLQKTSKMHSVATLLNFNMQEGLSY